MKDESEACESVLSQSCVSNPHGSVSGNTTHRNYNLFCGCVAHSFRKLAQRNWDALRHSSKNGTIGLMSVDNNDALPVKVVSLETARAKTIASI